MRFLFKYGHQWLVMSINITDQFEYRRIIRYKS